MPKKTAQNNTKNNPIITPKKQAKLAKFISTSKAAAQLGVSPTTLRRLESEGKISSVRKPNGYRVFHSNDIKNLKIRLKSKRVKLEQKRAHNTKIKATRTKVKSSKFSRNLSKGHAKAKRLEGKAVLAAFLMLLTLALAVNTTKSPQGINMRTAIVKSIVKSVSNMIESNNYADRYKDFEDLDLYDRNILGERDVVSDFVFNINIPTNLNNDVRIGGILTAPSLAGNIAIDATTKTTFENTLELAGDITGLLNNTEIGEKAITGSHLADEITYTGTLNLEGELQTEGDAGSDGQVLTSTGGGVEWLDIDTEDADTLDSLDSTQFLRSDISTVYSSGTLSFSDATFVDMSLITHDDTALQGLRLPQNTALSNPISGEGFIAYDTDADKVYVYNGSAWTDISGASTPLQEAYEGGGTVLMSAGEGDIRIYNDSLAELLFLDESSGLVGIGTTLPTDKLHVVGDILATTGFHVGSDSTATLIDDAANGASSTILYIGNESILVSGDIGVSVQGYDANTSLIGQTIEGSEIANGTIEEIDLEITNSPTNDYILSYDSVSAGFTWIVNDGGSGASKWTDNGTVTYLTSETDDLAIGGTTLADSIFSIDESTATFLFGGDNSANPVLRFEATDNDTGDLVFTTSDSWGFLEARVGIGTTSPSTELEVIGTITATSFSDGATSLSGGTLDFGTNTITDTNFTGNWDFNSGELSGIGAFTAASTITFSGLSGGTDDTVVILNASDQLQTREINSQAWTAGVLADVTAGSANYSAIFSDSDTITSGTIYDNGSIGIGTTAPTDTLHVVGNILATTGLHIGVDGDGTLIDDSSNGGSSTTLYIGSDSILVSGDIGTSVQGYDANTSLIGQTIEGSEITDGTIEEVDLEVTNSPTDDYMLTYDSGTGGFTWVDTATAGVFDGSGVANYITRFVDNNTLTSSSLYETGSQIGIGTTAPSSTLHVVGDLTVDNLNLNGNALAATTSAGLFLIDDSGNFNNGIFVEDGGFVGIGTTNPSSLLSVGPNEEFTVTSDGTISLIDDSLLDLSAITHNDTAPQGLLLPQATVLSSPSSGEGYIAYDTDADKVYIYNGSAWTDVSGASTTLNEAYEAGEEITLSAAQGDIRIYNDGGDELLFLDEDTGYVGIGTTAPAYKLDVNGDIRLASGSDLYIGTIGLNDTGSATTSGAYLVGTFDEFDNSNSATVQGVLNDLDAAIGSGASKWTDGGTVTYLTSLTDNLAIGGSEPGSPFFFNTSSELLTLTNTTSGLSFRVNDEASDTSPFVIDESGNVGIGTTNPTEKLEVANATKSRIEINGTGSGGDAGLVFTENNNQAMEIVYDGGDNRLYFDDLTTSTTRVTIERGGNVGIGTTDPSYKLEVAGTLLATDYYSGDGTQGAGTTTGGLTFKDGLYTSGTATTYDHLQNLGEVYAQDGSTGNSVELTATNGDIRFYNDASKEILFLDESSGYVGIGTTNPEVKLDILGSSDTVQLKVTANSTQTSYISEYYGTSGLNFYVSNNRVGFGAGSQRVFDGVQYIRPNGDGAILNINDIYDGNVLISNGGGNVGIGTTNPASLLSAGASNQFQVDSSGDIVRINDVAYSFPSSQAAADNYVLTNDSAGNLTWESISGAGGIDGTGIANYLPLWSDSDTLTSSGIYETGGKIGIGTTAPSQFLDIVATATTPDAIIKLTAYDANPFKAGIEVGGGSAGTQGQFYLHTARGTDRTITTASDFDTYLTTAGTTNLILGTNSTELLRLTSGGNVGIGTTDPSYKLEVAGTLLATDYYSGDGTQGADSTTGGLTFKDGLYTSGTATTYDHLQNLSEVYAQDGSTGNAVELTATNGDIRFYNDAAAEMLFLDESTGYVGIGTTSPSELLHVGSSGGDSAYFEGDVGIRTTSPGRTLTIGGRNGGINVDLAFEDPGGTAINTIGSDLVTTNDFLIATTANMRFYAGSTIGTSGIPTNEVLRISSTGNVGIGTTSPTSLLSVGASSQFQVDSNGDIVKINNVTYSFPSSQAGADNYVLTNDSVGNLTWESVSGVGGVDGTGTTNYLPLWSDSNTLTSSGIYETGGDIGIGTTAPEAKLHVSGGNILLDYNQSLQGEYSTGGVYYNLAKIGSGNNIYLSDTGRDTIIQSANYLRLQTGGVDRWTLYSTMFRPASDNSGQLGDFNYRISRAYFGTGGVSIGDGATPPSSGLYVAGNVGIGTTAPGYKLEVAGTLLATDYYSGDGTQGAGATTGGLTFKDGLYTSGTATTYDHLQNLGEVYAQDGSTGNAVELTASNGDIRFYNDAAAEILFLDESTGYVGVGTTAPASSLHLASSTSPQLTISHDTSPSYNVEIGHDGILNLNAAASNLWQFRLNDSNKMVIDRDGDVGIGTGTPASRLSVLGGVAVGDSTYVAAVAPTGGAIIQGKIGIGTTSPAHELDVQGSIRLGDDTSANNEFNTVAGSAAGADLYWGDDLLCDVSEADCGISSGGSSLFTDDGATTYLTALTDNLAIGGSSPDVAVFGVDEGLGTIYLGGDSVVDPELTFTASGGATGDLGYNDNDTFFFSGGNVGIGTTNADYMLDIISSDTTGALQITGDSVTTGTGALFSFDGLTSGTGVLLESTVAGTLSGDLLRLNVGSSTIVTGNIFTIEDNGSPLFTVDQSVITSALPHSFTAAGDVSMAYDLQFTNQTSSFIKSKASLYIEAGESFENNDLTLKTYGTGDVYLDLSGTGNLQLEGTDTSMIFNTTTTTDTDFWIGVIDDAGNDDDDIFVIGDGTTPGSNNFLSIDTSGNVGIGTTAPGSKLDVAGTVEMTGFKLTTSPTNNYVLTSDADGVGTWQAASGGVSGTGVASYLPLWSDASTLTSSSLYETGGSIGIGTTAPSDELHVVGNILATAGFHVGADGSGTLIDDAINGSTSTVLYIGSESILTSGGIGVTLQGFDAETSILGSSIEGSEITDNTIEEGDLEVTNSPTDDYILTFDTTTAGFTWAAPTSMGLWNDEGTYLYPDNVSDVVIMDTGYVGIGTTSPSDTLHVVGNIFATAGIHIQNDSTDYLIDDESQGTGSATLYIGNESILVSGDITTSVQGYDANTSILGSFIEGSEITDGTIEEIDLEITNAPTDNYMLTYDSATAGFTWVAASTGTVDGTGTANYLPIWSDSDTLTSSSLYETGGKIGIGTTAPQELLEISGGSKPALRILRDYAGGGYGVSLWSYWDPSVGETMGFGVANGGDPMDNQKMVITNTGLVGIGTTAPSYMLDLVSTSTTGGLEVTADSVTTGTGSLFSFDGLTSGTGVLIESAPSSATTLSGDLFKINVGANSTVTGSIFTIEDNGSALFSVNQAVITSAIPHSFTAAGDVSMAYDLILTNQTSSKIESYAPFTIEVGESNESNDLTLKTYNDGNVYINLGTGKTGASSQLLVDGDIATFIAGFANDGNLDTRQGMYIQGCLDTNPTTACNLLEFRDGDGTIIGAIEGNGAGSVTAASGGSDYAELFGTNDPTLSPGDIIALDTDGKVIKATLGSKLLGAYSTNPNTLGNWFDGWENDNTVVPVGLLGQIKVKVGYENGQVLSGDPIAVSPTNAGLGVKATEAQRIIGFAMSSAPEMDEGTEVNDPENYVMVKVYISPTWHDPKMALGAYGELVTEINELAVDVIDINTSLKTAQDILDSNDLTPITDDINSLKEDVKLINDLLGLSTVAESTEATESSSATTLSGIIKLKEEMLTVFEEFKTFVASLGLSLDEQTQALVVSVDMNVLGAATFTDVIVSGDLSAGLVSIDSLNNAINILGAECYNAVTKTHNEVLCEAQTLYLQKGLAGNIDLLNGAMLIEPDGTVTINKLTIDTTDTTSPSAGQATILAGEISIEITTNALSPDSLIFATPKKPVAVGTKITGINTFVVELANPLSDDISIDWLIVDRKVTPIE